MRFTPMMYPPRPAAACAFADAPLPMFGMGSVGRAPIEGMVKSPVITCKDDGATP